MTGRVFITGDKHGAFNPIFGLSEKVEIRENDILIIAGDTSYFWDEDYEYKVETLHQIFPGIIAFVDGNHENFDLLDEMKVENWNGGKVHQVGERIYHLMRGEIYSIHGESYFVFGGARSNDRDRRIEGKDWWKQEEPSCEEIDYGRRNLLENLDNIDYVITHEAPLFTRKHLTRVKPIDEDYVLPEIFDEWYEKITAGKRFRKWYFGHMHVDKVIEPKLRAIFSDIEIVGYDETVNWI